MKKFKLAILDRDGVLNKSNVNKGYIGNIKNFSWITGAKKTIKFLNEKKYKVVIVSNQSGIARNYFKYRDVTNLHNFIKKDLKKIDAKIDRIFFCPHHKDGVINKYKIVCRCRKPKNLFFKKIQKIWSIDKRNSFMIGDQITDMQFAKKSGIKGLFFNEKNLYKFVKKKLRDEK